jgi:hypothetical protein
VFEEELRTAGPVFALKNTLQNYASGINPATLFSAYTLEAFSL